MLTIQEIRRANLRSLLEEVEAELGAKRGAAAELSRRTGVVAPFISQFLSCSTYADGKERAMGDSQARKLEAGMRKPEGWMDADHAAASDCREAALLDKLRALTPAQRKAIEMLLDQFVPRHLGQAERGEGEGG